MASACHSPTGPEVVAVSLQVAQAAVPAGVGVATTVVAQNAGSTVVRLTGGSGCVAYLEVRTASGELVGGDSRVCTMDLVQHPVAPGAALTDRPMWDGRRGTSASAATPGVYTLRGGVTLADGRQVWSAPVSVTVTPP